MADTLTLKSVAEMRKWRRGIKGTVGFIPTMGFLHSGHVSLIDLAREQNDHVVVSIFVNPKQFGVSDDFKTYPRNLAHDLSLIKNAVVFAPSVQEMYPSGFETQVSVLNLSKKLEGERRPGHFDGVTTVVAKLFNIVEPSKAYFGQKDAQQVVIIKKMVEDLSFHTAIVVGETIREVEGLAKSSRNTFLRTQELSEARVLFASLVLAQDLVKKGERDGKKIKQAMRFLIEKTEGKIDYISIADPQSLSEKDTLSGKVLVSLAVFFGRTRLIDNCLITL